MLADPGKLAGFQAVGPSAAASTHNSPATHCSSAGHTTYLQLQGQPGAQQHLSNLVAADLRGTRKQAINACWMDCVMEAAGRGQQARRAQRQHLCNSIAAGL